MQAAKGSQKFRPMPQESTKVQNKSDTENMLKYHIRKRKHRKKKPELEGEFDPDGTSTISPLD